VAVSRQGVVAALDISLMARPYRGVVPAWGRMPVATSLDGSVYTNELRACYWRTESLSVFRILSGCTVPDYGWLYPVIFP
jgi:hypothetical protein